MAIEYLVYEEEAEGHRELFGHPFDGPTAGDDALQGTHRDMHVGTFDWASNPAGTFPQHDPDLHCLPA